MRWLFSVLLLLAGGAQALSIAWPFEAERGQPNAVLQIAALTVLAAYIDRSHSPRQAMMGTVVFATAWLVGCTWWLYISLHQYGGMPAPLAGAAVVLLSLALAWIYGGAAWWWRRSVSVSASVWVKVAGFAAVWTLAELVRGTVATGFPWGAVGYAHVEGVLRHLAPWLGVYGLCALSAALAMFIGVRRQGLQPDTKTTNGLAATLGGVLLLMWGLSPSQSLRADAFAILTPSVETPHTLRVALLQGNVPQDLKFGSEAALALQHYRTAMLQEQADLVVTPETALTFLPEQIPPDYWRPLRQVQDRALLMGLPMRAEPARAGYTNSVLGIAPGLPADFRYDKHHLVPFGEFVPPAFEWFVRWMHIPLGDFAKGHLPQPPLAWMGQRISVNICFEDLFGEELAQSFADPAHAPTLLLNVSNLAWFGNTVALDQHLHIARMRALELGRPMLRATNTGATAWIDARGDVVQVLPYETQGVLRATVRGVEGAVTPYAWWVSRWGLWPLAVAMLLLWAWAAYRSHRARHGPRRFSA